MANERDSYPCPIDEHMCSRTGCTEYFNIPTNNGKKDEPACVISARKLTKAVKHIIDLNVSLGIQDEGDTDPEYIDIGGTVMSVAKKLNIDFKSLVFYIISKE